MSETQNESLSALMDGELDELALHRLLNECEKNPELKQAWARYQLGRDALKGEVSAFSQLDISGAVSAAIAEESQPVTHKPWLKAVAGLSVAASVTFMVVLGAQFNPLVQSDSPQLVEKQTPAISTGLVAQSQTDLIKQGQQLQGKELQQAQERLNSYLKQHAQDSALGQGRTAMPFARVVNFESKANPNGLPQRQVPQSIKGN